MALSGLCFLDFQLAQRTYSPCFSTENFVCKTPRKHLLRESKQFDRSNLFEEVYDLRTYNDWNKYENQYGLMLNASIAYFLSVFISQIDIHLLRYFDLCSSFIFANQFFQAETEELANSQV